MLTAPPPKPAPRGGSTTRRRRSRSIVGTDLSGERQAHPPPVFGPQLDQIARAEIPDALHHPEPRAVGAQRVHALEITVVVLVRGRLGQGGARNEKLRAPQRLGRIAVVDRPARASTPPRAAAITSRSKSRSPCLSKTGP